MIKVFHNQHFKSFLKQMMVGIFVSLIFHYVITRLSPILVKCKVYHCQIWALFPAFRGALTIYLGPETCWGTLDKQNTQHKLWTVAPNRVAFVRRNGHFENITLYKVTILDAELYTQISRRESKTMRHFSHVLCGYKSF